MLARAVITVLCALVSIAPARAADDRAMADTPLRAAIVLNVIRFVDFGMADADDPLVLCIGHASGPARWLAALRGARSGSRTVATRELNLADSAMCHVAYLGSGNTGAIARLHRTGILLIGEGAEFIDAGGTIGLIGFGTRLHFEANTRAARDARIKLSSKLLRLASRVR